MRRGETQEQEASAVLILLTFKDFSGDRTGDQPLVKCTVGQHSHQQKHKADGKKRVCFQSHEALNHAAHKYLSPRFLFFLFPSVLKGWKGTPLTLTVTAVRREIFPHPCSPHNKKGLSCLSDKTGIPWHRGIYKVRDVHCRRSQCLSANETDLSVIFSNSICTLHKLSHWICIIISRIQMRKRGLPMVPKPDNNGRTQRAAHLCRKQVSPLIQSLLYTTSLLQDLHYYLFLLTERNLKRIFASSIQHLFCSELLTDAEHSPQWQEQYRQTPALGTTQHFSIQSSWLGTEPMSIWASPRFILCVH